MTDSLPPIVTELDDKLEQFVDTYNNYPKYVLMGYETYIEFYKSHFVNLKGQIPLTLQIDEYKNVEIVLVPHTKQLLQYSGYLEETENTLLEEALRQQLNASVF